MSSATPRIGSCNDSGTSRMTWISPERRTAIPLSVPIHIAPLESSERQFTLPGGKPFRLPYSVQLFCNRELRPLAVPNHIVPSELSRMEVTVLDARPFAVVYVVNFPSLNLVRPPLMLPA